MGAHFLVDRLISRNSALDMQPDDILDEKAHFVLNTSAAGFSFWALTREASWARYRSRLLTSTPCTERKTGGKSFASTRSSTGTILLPRASAAPTSPLTQEFCTERSLA